MGDGRGVFELTGGLDEMPTGGYRLTTQLYQTGRELAVCIGAEVGFEIPVLALLELHADAFTFHHQAGGNRLHTSG